MTFKDQMKAAGKSSDAPTPESEDIAKLLRALNDDLKADPIDDVADLEDDDEEPKAASGGLPLGKIAAALIAAAGIGFAVVMLDPGGSPPGDPSATTSLVPPAPAITRAPAANTANPAPESLIARAPVASAPALPVPPPAAPPPTPPAGAAPMAPPPALKAPEPPALPPTAAPASAARPAPVAKPAEPPHAAPPAATPASQAAAAQVAAAPTPAEAPAPKAAEAPPAKPAEPPAPKAAETGALQAMLAPPKDPREVAKRPPPPAKPAETKAADAKPTVKTPPQPAAPPPSGDAVPNGRYSVQVGSYQVAENAAIQVQKLKKAGYAAFGLEWTDSANKTWHAVRVGGYADKAAAQQAANDLKAKMGVPAYPVSAR